MKIFLLIFLLAFNLFGQDGEWKYVDGWVYVNKTKEDSTAGGAIISKKTNQHTEIKSTNNLNYIQNKELLRSIAVDPYQDNKMYVGEINGQSLYFNTRPNVNMDKPLRCRERNPRASHSLPEPNSNSYFLISFVFFLFIRHYKMFNLIYLNREVPKVCGEPVRHLDPFALQKPQIFFDKN